MIEIKLPIQITSPKITTRKSTKISKDRRNGRGLYFTKKHEMRVLPNNEWIEHEE